MRIRFRNIFKEFDWWLFLSAVSICGFGITLIYSLSWPEDNLFIKQIVFLSLGILIVFFVQIFDRNFWRNASVWLFFGTFILLLILLIFGEQTRGTGRWLYIGSFGFQVSELAKISAILFLATILEKLNFDIANFKHLILVAFIIIVPSVLIFFQPDFSSAFVLIVIGGVMVLFTGLEKTKLLSVIGIILIVSFVAWFGVLRDYQKQRIFSFLNPGLDPLGAGYNVQQSIVAIGSGGFWGRGLGLGTQSQLNFLPEKETDFIFASIAEELGFVGAFLLLLIYLIFFWRIYLSIKNGRELFSNFLILGIFTMFLVQSVINIGMNMGLLPVTGIPLPFVSYGGSSLVASFFAVGLIQSVRR